MAKLVKQICQGMYIITTNISNYLEVEVRFYPWNKSHKYTHL